MKVLLDGLKPGGKRMTTCHLLSITCSDNSKAGSEATEAAAKRQIFRKRLVVERRRWAKDRIHDNVEPRQKLYSDRKRIIIHAIPAV
jgi:hypothetical protein